MDWVNRVVAAACFTWMNGSKVAKPDHQFEKRQHEQQKKQKKAAKAERKVQATPAAPEANPSTTV